MRLGAHPVKKRSITWVPFFLCSVVLHGVALEWAPAPAPVSAKVALLTPALPESKPTPQPEAPRDEKKEKQAHRVSAGRPQAEIAPTFIYQDSIYQDSRVASTRGPAHL